MTPVPTYHRSPYRLPAGRRLSNPAVRRAIMEAPLRSPEGRLLEAHYGGDPAAFGRLVERYRDRLVSFVDRMIGDHARAEDLVQEAFMRVHRHGRRYDATRRFSTWLYRIAGNLARNELRNRRRARVVYESQWAGADRESSLPLAVADHGQRPDVVYDRLELREKIDGAVSRLTRLNREIFTLREIDALRYQEIAAQLEVSVGTVKSRLHRARRAVADELMK